jgi:peptide/nickel transport system permease protein
VASRSGPIGLALLLGLALTGVLASLLAPAEPLAFVGAGFQPPSAHFPLGTDQLGRDVLSGVLYGARVSLLVGVVAAGIAALVGTLVGSIAGYVGGTTDLLLSRLIDIFLTIPSFFLIVIVVATLDGRLFATTLILGLTSWPAPARLMRAQVLSLRSRPFVLAATAIGETRLGVLWRSIIPNSLAPVIANASLQAAEVILLEASLAFLGLGDPNMVSWGQMICAGQGHIQQAWWIALFPGLAVVLTVLALFGLSNGLRAALAGERVP